MRINQLIIFVFYLIAFSGCYEPEEGCLDTDATNYDVTADDNCESCCTLPGISLTMNYMYNGEKISIGDTIAVGEEAVIVSDFHFWLTDIHFTIGGADIRYEDSIRVYDAEDNLVWVQDDFRYFDRSSFRITIDGIRFTGPVDALTFAVGMSEIINTYDKDSIRINSAITTLPSGSFTPSQNFIFFQISLTSVETQEVLDLEVFEKYPLPRIMVPLNDVSLQRAEDVSVAISFHFDIALEGVSTEQDEENIINLIWQNLPNSFSHE